MQSYSILFLVFVAVSLVSGRPSNTATGHEDVQLLSPDDVNNPPEPRPAPTIVQSEEDKKLLLPLLALKPLVALVASGSNQKRPASTSKPAPPAPTTAAPTENNVLVVINSDDQTENNENDEPRLLLVPIAMVKPLIIASVMTGTKLAKLPAITLPKIGFAMTKHEYPNTPAINISTS
uniref:Uncharacterized protein n=1 Tax=Daphnia galeata TaxID=27404 RepID=A0A8J2RFQ5_9CRUS|nr:unnamed protein product [Daphnia galeata]